MHSGRTGWIGIDLGTRAVKLAQVERSGSGLRLAHARVVLRPDDGESKEPEAWWDEVFADRGVRGGFAGKQAACVLPASRTDLRSMNVPEGTDAERRAMIAGELEAAGAASGRRVFDFWDSRPPADATDSNLESVNLLSVAEDAAGNVADRAWRAGFRCAVLDGLPPALARAVTLVQPPEAAGPVAAVDWGHQSATFCVIYEGRPVFTRQLRDCGFASLPAAVAQALGLSGEDAEQLLTAFGMYNPVHREGPAGDVQEVLADVLTQPIGELVSELTKTLAYPELRRSRLAPQMIWLFGGGATVRNIAEFLFPRIGLPIRVWGLPEAGPAPVPAAILGPAIALSALAWES